MTTLNRGDREDLFLPAQQVLMITAGGGTGSVSRLGNKAGEQPLSYAEIAAGEIKTIGPFAKGRRYTIACLTGSISWDIQESDFPGCTSDIERIVKITQAAYDALSPPDAATLYVIVG